MEKPASFQDLVRLGSEGTSQARENLVYFRFGRRRVQTKSLRRHARNAFGRSVKVHVTLSAYLLTRETDQLAAQLASRLVPAHGPTITRLLDDLVRAGVFAPARGPYLTPPGPELHRLEGHTFGVTSVAVLPDGRRALSGAEGPSARKRTVAYCTQC